MPWSSIVNRTGRSWSALTPVQDQPGQPARTGSVRAVRPGVRCNFYRCQWLSQREPSHRSSGALDCIRGLRRVGKRPISNQRSRSYRVRALWRSNRQRGDPPRGGERLSLERCGSRGCLGYAWHAAGRLRTSQVAFASAVASNDRRNLCFLGAAWPNGRKQKPANTLKSRII